MILTRQRFGDRGKVGPVPDLSADGDARMRLARTRSRIYLALLVAFMIHVLAQFRYDRKNERWRMRSWTDALGLLTRQDVVAWGTLVLFLTILSDLDATSALAAAMAFVILIAVLMADGEQALDNVSHIGAPFAPPKKEKEVAT